MYESLLESLESGVTVVSANNRLARTLRHAYERRQIDLERSAWLTPDIVSWAEWLHRLWEESRLRGGVAAQRVLLSDSAASLLWQSAIVADKHTVDPGNVASLARHARSAWQALNDWDALSADEWTQPDLSPDQKAWLRWSGSYRNRCAQQSLVDTEQLCGLLTGDVQSALFDGLKPLQFCGFDAWVPARQRLLDALRAQRVGVEIVPDVDSETTFSPRARIVACQDQSEELRAAAAWARRCLEDQSGAAIGVVVPDLASRSAEARRVFLDALAPDWRVSGQPAGVPLNVSYGEPLAEVPVIAAALNVLTLGRGRAAFNDFSLWLRSRWFAGAATELAERGALDLRLRERLRIEFSLSTALPFCQKYTPEFAVILERLIAHAADRPKRSGAEWAQAFSSLLEAIGWPGDDSVDSAVWQALNAWQKLLRDFADSTTLLGDLSRGEALSALRQLALTRLHQPEGAAYGVQLLGVLEAAGHRFDRLWVCGMARECWPAASRPHPFIPLELQRRLGMPDASAARTLEQARTVAARLQASSAELTVSWPRAQDGESLTPSPLFVSVADGEADKVDSTSFTDWNAQMFAAGRTELLTNDPPPPWSRDTPVRGGASVLNLQAVSPLNAFIEKRLGAVEMRQPSVGINALQRGNLTHQALEEFYKAAPGHAEVLALTPAERVKRLQASLQRGLSRLPGAANPFMKRLAAYELQQQLERVSAFIELDLQRPPFRVVECEAERTVVIGSISLRLKLDRLDELPDGSCLVIDYKTGVVKRQSWNPASPRDLQLPLYANSLVSNVVGVSFAQVSSRGIGYDGVGVADLGIEGMRTPGRKSRTEVKFQRPYGDAVIESWDELQTVWDELLTSLAERFAAGDFRLDPRNPDSARGQFAVLSRVYDAGIGTLEEEA